MRRAGGRTGRASVFGHKKGALRRGGRSCEGLSGGRRRRRTGVGCDTCAGRRSPSMQHPRCSVADVAPRRKAFVHQRFGMQHGGCAGVAPRCPQDAPEACPSAIVPEFRRSHQLTKARRSVPCAWAGRDPHHASRGSCRQGLVGRKGSRRKRPLLQQVEAELEVGNRVQALAGADDEGVAAGPADELVWRRHADGNGSGSTLM